MAPKQTFIASSEQRHFDSVPHPERLPPSSTITPKFHQMTGQKRGAVDDDDDDDEDEDEDDVETGAGAAPVKGKNSRKRNATSTGRRKIDIQYIGDKSKRHVSFTKRKSGLMKKAYELSTLTGTEVLILVVSESNLCYTYATPSLKAMVDSKRGQNHIQLALRGELTDDIGDDNLPQMPPLPSTFSSSSHHNNNSNAINTSNDLIIDDPSSYQTSYSGPSSLPPISAAHQQPSSFDFGSTSVGSPSATTDAYIARIIDPILDPSLPYLPPPPILPPAPQQSAYEKASSNHALAYSNYQAQQSATSHPPSLPPPMSSAPQGFPHIPMNQLPPVPPASRQFYSYSNDGSGGASTSNGGTGVVAGARAWKTPSISKGKAKELDYTVDFANIGANLGSGGLNGIEDRRKAVKEEADLTLRVAKAERTIQAFIHAHSVAQQSQLLANTMLGPTSLELAGKKTSGILATLQELKGVCETYGFSGKHDLRKALQALFQKAFVTLAYSQKQLQEARTHLTFFLDFLESNHFITEDDSRTLGIFTFEGLSPLPDPVIDIDQMEGILGAAGVASWGMPLGGGGGPGVDEIMRDWVRGGTDKKRRALEASDAFVVKEWFEVYRVRSNFVLLRAKDQAYPEFSPFKVLMSRQVVPKLKIDDLLLLGIRKMVGRDGWVVEEFGFVPIPLLSVIVTSSKDADHHCSPPSPPFLPLTSLFALSIYHLRPAPGSTGYTPSSVPDDGIESDIDAEMYSNEIRRLNGVAQERALTVEEREELNMLEETWERLCRAKGRLADGDFSE